MVHRFPEGLILMTGFLFSVLSVQLLKLPIISAGHNNEDKCILHVLVCLPVHFCLKFKFLYLQRLRQSWFCLAWKVAILQHFEFVKMHKLSVPRWSFPRFLYFLITGINMCRNKDQSWIWNKCTFYNVWYFSGFLLTVHSGLFNLVHTFSFTH